MTFQKEEGCRHLVQSPRFVSSVIRRSLGILESDLTFFYRLKEATAFALKI